MEVHPYINPSISTVSKITEAVEFNNQANRLDQAGNHAGAIELHLKALKLKISAVGEESWQVAMTKNSLAEVYMKMGNLEDARKMLEDADRVRSPLDNFDSACTRDNLGRLYEMRGDVTRAKLEREKQSDRMVCGHFDCPKAATSMIWKRTELKMCQRCQCVWYCDRECQKKDWKKRHKSWCKEPETNSSVE
ncbi:hypothetical protein MFRU_033g00010 [Monilinia fructicola]|uniref:MYND-type domain-containing protein n=1 Tax=Monilinia fructicola TaxID=38448 RepID=A0A5M9K740_MONFR|nr:hypothetical protein EYC84_006199 [Monilinia fructicola]KAG4027030.1 hypothetical protein MFRU_033g00010 [Monilinia fructicola]